MNSKTHMNRRYVYISAAVATIGGLLFGYDTAVISGTIIFLQKQFALSPMMEGWAVSCVLIGCVAGVSFAGSFSDKWGRKKGMLLAACLFSLSAIGCALSGQFYQFVIFRFIGGIGVGIASMLSPMYIAEISPAPIRGRLTAMNQLAIITGMLVTYIVNWALVDIGPNNWRWMFAAEAIPSSLFLVALFFVPESPRWLAKSGREQESLSILTKIGGAEFAINESQNIKLTLDHKKVLLKQLFTKEMRLPLLIGSILAIFTQVTGINTILYYAPKIFIMAGIETASSAYANAIMIGVVNVFFTVLAVMTVDQIGRRRILIIAVCGMGLFLMLMGLAFMFDTFPSGFIVFFVFFFFAFFMYGLGSGFWVLVAEIYPNQIRGRALSVVTIVLWSATFLVAQTFPLLIAHMGEAGTFWIYACMCILAFGFIYKYIPETKGKTLEEIEAMWTGKKEKGLTHV